MSSVPTGPKPLAAVPNTVILPEVPPAAQPPSGAAAVSGDEDEDSKDNSPFCNSYFVSSEAPERVAHHLKLKDDTLLFGGHKKGVLGFASQGTKRKFLSKVGECFSLPIMEEQLGKEGLDNALNAVKDLSLKAFIACRVVESGLATERKDFDLKTQTTNRALEKEVEVVKTLHQEKVSLAEQLDTEKKKHVETQTELDKLRVENELLRQQITQTKDLEAKNVALVEDVQKEKE